MPSKGIQTEPVGERPIRSCKVCQIQLGIEWLYLVDRLFDTWIDRPWAPTFINRAFWGVVSVSTVVALYSISDEPYLCGKGRQTIRGRHMWGRQATIGMEAVQYMNVGACRVARWFWARCVSSQRSDESQEPKADNDYDFCGVE